jgi:hypothetical protein
MKAIRGAVRPAVVRGAPHLHDLPASGAPPTGTNANAAARLMQAATQSPRARAMELVGAMMVLQGGVM